VLPVVLALIAYAALMCASLGPLSPPPAAASTSLVLTLPSKAKPELLGASSNGQYFAYADHTFGYSEGTLALHWYNQQTGDDVVVGVVSDADLGRISADGHHIVFTSWGNDPLGGGLAEGTVYEATIDENGAVSYTQVSPLSTEAQYARPTTSGDGSIVSYEAPGKANYIWSRSTGTSTQLQALGGTPAVLSADGSTVAAVAGAGLTEYSASDGSVIRAISTANAPNVYELSADGSYGVGVSGGTRAQTGYAYINFTTGTVQVIPNSASEGHCGGGYYSSIATSADGQVVAFGSLSTELVPDPSGGSLGYFSYEPASEQVVNLSGSYAGPPPSEECPSVAITGDGQTMFFVSSTTPSETVGWISGKVTDSLGNPLAFVVVDVFEANGSFPVAQVQTNGSGNYTTEGLLAGSYKVKFSASSEIGNYAFQYFNGKSSLAEADAVQVTRGSVTPGIDATMQAGGQISGEVTDSASKALANVQVSAFEAGGSRPVATAMTNSSGGYTMPALASGSYKVEFSANSEVGNYAPQYYNVKSSLAEAEPVSVTAGSTTPEINAQMQPGGQITGTVTDSEGKPLQGVDVSVFEAGGSSTVPVGYTQTDPTGDYTVADLASGSYIVEFSANFYSVGSYAPQYYNAKSTWAEAEPVSVTAGSTTPGVNAALTKGASPAAATRGIAAGASARRDFAQATTTKAEGDAYIYKSTFTPAILPPSPVKTVPPSISGNAVQGQTLTEAHGSWTNYPTSYSYQWQDCDSAGNNCSVIVGATGPTYTLSASDVGHTIRVQETASNSAGPSAPATSEPTALVTAPATGGGSTGTAGGGSTGTGGALTGAAGLTGGGSTLGTGVGAMLSNAFTLGGSQPGSNGSLLVTADVPGPGTLTAQQAGGGHASIAAKKHKRKGRAQPKLISPASVTARKAGAVTLTLKPTTAALKLLRSHRSVKVSVRITFTPTGGTPSNHTIQVTFKAPKGKHGH
jgi:5-hydroxyisourate hydrolase-like protein (transthyretin family)